MKSIAFVIPYFGKLPDYLPVWLASCAQNPTIDFYLFTDDQTAYTFPDNVKVIYKKFDDIKALLQAQFDFPISLDHAYKLCDYKPVYGAAFSEWIGMYDFWGHCDVDIIWGNIRNFFSEERLSKYDRILWQGHCSIYKNCARMNYAFKTLDPRGCMNWKDVYTSDAVMAFDEYAEHNGGGLSLIMEKNGIPMYKEWIFADLCVGLNRFQCAYTENSYYTSEEDSRVCFFERNKTGLYLLYRKNGEIHKKEMMYVHFQKRHVVLKTDLKNDGTDLVLILPPGIIKAIKKEISEKDVKKLFNRNNRLYLWRETLASLPGVKFSKRVIRKANQFKKQH